MATYANVQTFSSEIQLLLENIKQLDEYIKQLQQNADYALRNYIDKANAFLNLYMFIKQQLIISDDVVTNQEIASLNIDWENIDIYAKALRDEPLYYQHQLTQQIYSAIKQDPKNVSLVIAQQIAQLNFSTLDKQSAALLAALNTKDLIDAFPSKLNLHESEKSYINYLIALSYKKRNEASNPEGREHTVDYLTMISNEFWQTLTVSKDSPLALSDNQLLSLTTKEASLEKLWKLLPKNRYLSERYLAIANEKYQDEKTKKLAENVYRMVANHGAEPVANQAKILCIKYEIADLDAALPELLDAGIYGEADEQLKAETKIESKLIFVNRISMENLDESLLNAFSLDDLNELAYFWQTLNKNDVREGYKFNYELFFLRLAQIAKSTTEQHYAEKIEKIKTVISGVFTDAKSDTKEKAQAYFASACLSHDTAFSSDYINKIAAENFAALGNALAFLDVLNSQQLLHFLAEIKLAHTSVNLTTLLQRDTQQQLLQALSFADLLNNINEIAKQVFANPNTKQRLFDYTATIIQNYVAVAKDQKDSVKKWLDYSLVMSTVISHDAIKLFEQVTAVLLGALNSDEEYFTETFELFATKLEEHFVYAQKRNNESAQTSLDEMINHLVRYNPVLAYTTLQKHNITFATFIDKLDTHAATAILASGAVEKNPQLWLAALKQAVNKNYLIIQTVGYYLITGQLFQSSPALLANLLSLADRSTLESIVENISNEADAPFKPEAKATLAYIILTNPDLLTNLAATNKNLLAENINRLIKNVYHNLSRQQAKNLLTIPDVVSRLSTDNLDRLIGLLQPSDIATIFANVKQVAQLSQYAFNKLLEQAGKQANNIFMSLINNADLEINPNRTNSKAFTANLKVHELIVNYAASLSLETPKDNEKQAYAKLAKIVLANMFLLDKETFARAAKPQQGFFSSFLNWLTGDEDEVETQRPEVNMLTRWEKLLTDNNYADIAQPLGLFAVPANLDTERQALYESFVRVDTARKQTRMLILAAKAKDIVNNDTKELNPDQFNQVVTLMKQLSVEDIHEVFAIIKAENFMQLFNTVWSFGKQEQWNIQQGNQYFESIMLRAMLMDEKRRMSLQANDYALFRQFLKPPAPINLGLMIAHDPLLDHYQQKAEMKAWLSLFALSEDEQVNLLQNHVKDFLALVAEHKEEITAKHFKDPITKERFETLRTILAIDDQTIESLHNLSDYETTETILLKTLQTIALNIPTQSRHQVKNIKAIEAILTSLACIKDLDYQAILNNLNLTQPETIDCLERIITNLSIELMLTKTQPDALANWQQLETAIAEHIFFRPNKHELLQHIDTHTHLAYFMLTHANKMDLNEVEYEKLIHISWHSDKLFALFKWAEDHKDSKQFAPFISALHRYIRAHWNNALAHNTVVEYIIGTPELIMAASPEALKLLADKVIANKAITQKAIVSMQALIDDNSSAKLRRFIGHLFKASLKIRKAVSDKSAPIQAAEHKIGLSHQHPLQHTPSTSEININAAKLIDKWLPARPSYFTNNKPSMYRILKIIATNSIVHVDAENNPIVFNAMKRAGYAPNLFGLLRSNDADEKDQILIRKMLTNVVKKDGISAFLAMPASLTSDKEAAYLNKHALRGLLYDKEVYAQLSFGQKVKLFFKTADYWFTGPIFARPKFIATATNLLSQSNAFATQGSSKSEELGSENIDLEVSKESVRPLSIGPLKAGFSGRSVCIQSNTLIEIKEQSLFNRIKGLFTEIPVTYVWVDEAGRQQIIPAEEANMHKPLYRQTITISDDAKLLFKMPAQEGKFVAVSYFDPKQPAKLQLPESINKKPASITQSIVEQQKSTEDIPKAVAAAANEEHKEGDEDSDGKRQALKN